MRSPSPRFAGLARTAPTAPAGGHRPGQPGSQAGGHMGCTLRTSRGLASCIAVAATLAAAATAAGGVAAPAERQNVLYLISDDLRPEFQRAYNQTKMLTPHTDKLAAEGLVFSRAYCQYAVCGPVRATQPSLPRECLLVRTTDAPPPSSVSGSSAPRPATPS